MALIDRIDPELHPLLAMLPPGFIDVRDVPAARALLGMMMSPDMLPAPRADVQISDHHAPGTPPVLVRLYRPAAAADATLPAYLWLHGGGYVLGRVADSDATCAELAHAVGCVVASVEYRLAPEHPFPAALDDAYAALTWLAAAAPDLAIDAQRIAIGGNSAGGGLAAGLALYARDQGGVQPCFQLLTYPMLDDRMTTPSAQWEDTPVWPRTSNVAGWHAYLGRPAGGDDVSPYAAPARATDLRGLPPAYIPVGDADLFLDEDIAYARRLIDAGVPVELHIFGGAFHGWDALMADSQTARRLRAEEISVLRRALGTAG